MNDNQIQVLSLIDLALHGKKNNFVSIDDYNVLFCELKDQAVLGVPLEYMIYSMDAPEEQKTHWTKIVYGQVANWTKLMEAQDELVKLLNENHICFAIIKGIVAAMNYPKPEYRSMGDVDFVVRPEDFDKVYSLLLEYGYVCFENENDSSFKNNSDVLHHMALKKNGIVFELHRHMLGTVQGRKMDQKSDALIIEGLNHIQIGQVGEYEFPMFETKLNGLIILKHIIQHISGIGGVGLRHVIDWMEFVEKHVDDAFWNDEFAEYLERVKLKDAAIVFARMGQMYLGLDESITWCKIADDKLCEQWMEDILASGNFGKKKDTKAEEGASVIYKNRNVFAMFGSLQELGLHHWEPARKHAVLRPFAWIYQICRYVRKGLFRKSPIKSLKQDLNKGNYKKEMIKGLKVN